MTAFIWNFNMLRCQPSTWTRTMVRVAELSTAESKKPIALFLCIMTHEMWINVCTHRSHYNLTKRKPQLCSLFSCMTFSTIQLCSSNLTRFWLALIAFFWLGSHIHSPIFLNLNSAIIFILSMFRLFSFL